VRGLESRVLPEENNRALEPRLYQQIWQTRRAPFPSPSEVIHGLEATLDTHRDDIAEIEQVDRHAGALDRLCGSYVGAALVELGWNGERPSEAVLERLGIAPQHLRFVQRLVEIHETVGHVSGDAESLWESLLAALPFYRLELTLIRRIGER